VAAAQAEVGAKTNEVRREAPAVSLIQQDELRRPEPAETNRAAGRRSSFVW